MISPSDGTTDYSKLSDKELDRARVVVDYELNPVDHTNIRSEIKRRKLKRQTKRLPIMLRVVGGFFALGAGLALTEFIPLLTAQTYTVEVTLLVSALGLMISITACAGIFLLLKKAWAPKLGVVAAVLQLVAFSFSSVSYQFIPLYAIRVFLRGSHFGIELLGGPEVGLYFGSGFPVSLSFDLVSGYALLVLIRSIRKSRRAAHQ